MPKPVSDATNVAPGKVGTECRCIVTEANSSLAYDLQFAFYGSAGFSSQRNVSRSMPETNL